MICASGSDGVLGGNKDLYWFGQNVPTSSLLLLVLPALVCSRGYKWTREGADPRSLVEGLKSAESLFSHVLVRPSWDVLLPLL